jgi:hypothetical protein
MLWGRVWGVRGERGRKFGLNGDFCGCEFCVEFLVDESRIYIEVRAGLELM